MPLYDDFLSRDVRFTEAHRKSDGRSDPASGGFGRRLSVEPKTADRWTLWIAVGAVVLTIILTAIGAV